MITGNTRIQTDPAIANKGGTDYGKIYRTPADDGPFSAWAFTVTSPFDLISGIDDHFGNSANEPIAAFKFDNLRLDADPIISTANGGTTKLALIAVNGITSGGFARRLLLPVSTRCCWRRKQAQSTWAASLFRTSLSFISMRAARDRTSRSERR